MKIMVIGTGYVGLIQGVGLAELGNEVVCVDNNVEKIAMLKRGKSPIFEPGLDELLQKNIATGRLRFDDEIATHVNESDVIFIAVGTPSDESGRADTRAVMQVTEVISNSINSDRVIVIKSTVPIGTNEIIKRTIKKKYAGQFSVVSNPEFLREGSAIADFFHPDRVVIGVDDKSRAAEILSTLYQPLSAPIVVTNPAAAEMIKYASNSYLATQISFINSIARICEQMGADVADVARGMKLDARIGSKAFLSAGLGYGGSCFPKDVRALIAIAQDSGEDFEILEATEAVNHGQRARMIKKIKDELGNLAGKTVAVWGVAFKPGTDDVRDAPAVEIITRLCEEGASVKVYDPVVEKKSASAIMTKSALEACEGADGLIIMTEWPEFLKVKWAKVIKKMNTPLVIDGRNMFEPKEMKKLGIIYRGIGRM